MNNPPARALAQVLGFSSAFPIVGHPTAVVMPTLKSNRWSSNDDPDDLQYMVAVTRPSPKRQIVVFVTGRMSLEECSSFVQAFDDSFLPPNKDLFFEHRTTVICSSAGYTLLDGMPEWLEYFHRIFLTWEFTTEYTFNLHWHIMRRYSPGVL